MTKKSTPKPPEAEAKVLTGTERTFRDGKLCVPDPIVPTPAAQELEEKREADAIDELPANFAAALALQRKINSLPDKDKTKAHRLQRITKHVEWLQSVPRPPEISYADLHTQFWGPKPTPDQVARVRKSLTKS